MKKIIPFRKEIDFKTNISEITSISLEHTSNINERTVSGEFLVNGDYKMADTSTNTEDFNYNIPFDIEVDDKYVLDKAVVDIDDFYYEIINDRLLVLNIDVLLDHLEEKPLPIINKEELRDNRETEVNNIIEQPEEPELEEEIELEEESETEKELELKIEPEEPKERCIEEEIENPIIIKEKIEPVNKERANTMNIFENFNGNETYSTYSICIIREGDTVEAILEKYNVTKEELEEYNDLSNLTMGMKLIIPSK